MAGLTHKGLTHKFRLCDPYYSPFRGCGCGSIWKPTFEELKLYLGRQRGHEKHLENIRMIRSNTYVAIFHMTGPTLNTSHLLTYLILQQHQKLGTLFIPTLQVSKPRLRSHCL